MWQVPEKGRAAYPFLLAVLVALAAIGSPGPAAAQVTLQASAPVLQHGSTGDDRAVNTFEVTISDLKQLTELMRSIEKLNGVHSVERI